MLMFKSFYLYFIIRTLTKMNGPNLNNKLLKKKNPVVSLKAFEFKFILSLQQYIAYLNFQSLPEKIVTKTIASYKNVASGIQRKYVKNRVC